MAERRAAQALGFEVARRGPAAIDAALDRLVPLADGPGDGPKKASGRLVELLAQHHAAEPAFGAFRDLLRERRLSVRALDPGIGLPGEVTPARRLHAVVTAARQAGIGAAVREQVRIRDGAMAAGDPRPAARKTRPAAPHAGLLRRNPGLVGSPTLRRVMGASEAALVALAEDGVLRPRAALDVRAPRHPEDGRALVARACRVAPGDPGRARIQQAKARASARSSVRAGRLGCSSAECRIARAMTASASCGTRSTEWRPPEGPRPPTGWSPQQVSGAAAGWRAVPRAGRGGPHPCPARDAAAQQCGAGPSRRR